MRAELVVSIGSIACGSLLAGCGESNGETEIAEKSGAAPALVGTSGANGGSASADTGLLPYAIARNVPMRSVSGGCE